MQNRKRLAALIAAVGLILALIAAPLVAMATGASGAPVDEPDSVIVLGHTIEGREPSAMLLARCEAAADYLLAHPDAIVIASGGVTKGAKVSEAEVIRDTLVERGVDADRVLLEDRSTNTSENLALSATLLADRGLGGRVVIVTDGFHQYRAAYFARKNGLTPSPLCCETAPLAAVGYTCREMLAIYKAWLLGK